MYTLDKIWLTVMISLVAMAFIVIGMAAIVAPTKTVTINTSTVITSTIITESVLYNSTQTTTSCKTTMTVTGIQGQIHGSYPNGTEWVSIAGHIYNGISITNGTLPQIVVQEGNNVNLYWWTINNC